VPSIRRERRQRKSANASCGPSNFHFVDMLQDFPGNPTLFLRLPGLPCSFMVVSGTLIRVARMRSCPHRTLNTGSVRSTGTASEIAALGTPFGEPDGAPP
jgi:hypothetical protein